MLRESKPDFRPQSCLLVTHELIFRANVATSKKITKIRKKTGIVEGPTEEKKKMAFFLKVKVKAMLTLKVKN